ncbi:long-chain-fatty-acid--CoA ligase [Elysia marginata]|uniref:long-chain-fatty-acid--CoA ligase n=1 Tax=Elysia marginata TaxID=1093978 RepID=A0AAV4G4Y7_9GAST|nr:long-chain-fatty-acid--CoA ligase [Elysia marginata]
MESLGGRLEAIVSGSAALPEKLGRFYSAVGIIMIEGYGLTETSAVITVTNYREETKYGTVGTRLSHTQIKILEDGEIACKSPSVMLGYYKKNSKIKKVITKDGYFLTGDLGKLDKDGHLKITGRKKEIFKTSGGKYITPQRIENIFKASFFVENIIVIGEYEKMPAALIQPNFNFLDKWCKRKKIYAGDTSGEIVVHPLVYKRYAYEVRKLNKKLSKWEQIKAFELTPEVWSVEGGELTPTLKVKRKNTISKYKYLYRRIYGQDNALSL